MACVKAAPKDCWAAGYETVIIYNNAGQEAGGARLSTIYVSVKGDKGPWKAQFVTPAINNGFTRLSCPSTKDCWAFFDTSKTGTLYHFNGTSWRA
jgi:hypothetical protein